MESLKSPLDTSIHSYSESYVFVSQRLVQSGQDIKYTWSKKEYSGDGDTLETRLIANNHLVKILDNEGLVLTITVSKFWSTDQLFNGYVTWSEPIWNESNPNIIKSNEENKNHNPFGNMYKYDTWKYLSAEFDVYAGWNAQMPAHFINRRNGYKEEGRNIHYFQTLTPVSEFDDAPLRFWTECGDVDLTMVRDKKH